MPIEPSSLSWPDVPGYAIDEELGWSGSGRAYKQEGSVVYRGRQLSLDRPVAIKTMIPGDMPERLAQRLMREAQAVARLGYHPNLLQIYNVLEVEELPVIILEFVEGELLSDVLGRGDKIPPAKLMEWMGQAARGLAHAHQFQLIHRDIKPQNLLIDASGKLRVLNFGMSVMSNTSFVEGTDNSSVYYSPEVARGRVPTHPSSDTYSLCAVMFEMLTGRQPFQAKSFAELMRQVKDVPPVAPSSLNRSVAPAFDAIVAKGMAKQPAERYATMWHLLQALARVQSKMGFDPTCQPPDSAKSILANPPAAPDLENSDDEMPTSPDSELTAIMEEVFRHKAQQDKAMHQPPVAMKAMQTEPDVVHDATTHPPPAMVAPSMPAPTMPRSTGEVKKKSGHTPAKGTPVDSFPLPGQVNPRDRVPTVGASVPGTDSEPRPPFALAEGNPDSNPPGMIKTDPATEPDFGERQSRLNEIGQRYKDRYRESVPEDATGPVEPDDKPDTIGPAVQMPPRGPSHPSKPTDSKASGKKSAAVAPPLPSSVATDATIAIDPRTLPDATKSDQKGGGIEGLDFKPFDIAPGGVSRALPQNQPTDPDPIGLAATVGGPPFNVERSGPSKIPPTVPTVPKAPGAPAVIPPDHYAVILDPKGKVVLDKLIEAMAAYKDVDVRTARRAIRQGKGLLATGLSRSEATILESAMIAASQPVKVVKEDWKQEPEPPRLVESIVWRKDLLELNYIGRPAHYIEPGTLRLIAAGFVVPAKDEDEPTGLLVDLVGKHPSQHWRWWATLPHAEASAGLVEARSKTQVDLIKRLQAAAAKAIVTPVAVRLGTGDLDQKHFFPNLANYDNYLRWHHLAHLA